MANPSGVTVIRLLSVWVVFGILLTATPLVLMWGIRDLDWSWKALLPLTVLLYASVRLAWIAHAGQPRIITLTLAVFVYCFFGVVPLLQVLGGGFSLKGSYRAHELFGAYLVVWVGLLAFELGQWLAGGRRRPGASGGVVRFATFRAFSRVRLLMLLAVGLLTLGAAIWSFGSTEFLFSSRAEVFEYFASLPGPGQVILNLASSAVRVPSLLVATAFLALLLAKGSFDFERHAYLKRLLAGTAVFAVLLGLISINPINSPRYLVGCMLLTMMFIWVLFHWRRSSMPFLVVVLVGSLMILFPMGDLFRYSTIEPLAYQIGLAGAVRNLTTKGDFDAFQQLLNVVSYVESNGLTYGHQLLGAVLFFAPRSIWAAKPDSSGVVVGGWMNYDFTNLSCPLWGEFYIDFGLVGVAAGFLAYGWMVSAIESAYLTLLGHRSAFGNVAIGTFAAYQVFLLRGSLLPALAYLAPIVLGLWFISTRLSFPASAEARPAALGTG